MKKDYFVVIGALLLAGVYLYETSRIPFVQVGDPLGPKAFPILLGVGLLISTAMLFIETRRGARNNAGSAEQVAEAAGGPRQRYLMLAGIVAATTVYFFVFEPLGFVVSTTLYLLGMTHTFHRGKWVANILTSVLVAIVSYICFTRFLGVSLPRGVLPF